MTQKKVQPSAQDLVDSNDLARILARYVELSVEIEVLKAHIVKDPVAVQAISGLLPKIPTVPLQPMGPAPWNPLPPTQAPLTPLMPGMQGQYQVPQEGVVDMTGTSQIGEFPMDEYIAGGAESRQGVIDLLGGIGTPS